MIGKWIIWCVKLNFDIIEIKRKSGVEGMKDDV